MYPPYASIIYQLLDGIQEELAAFQRRGAMV